VLPVRGDGVLFYAGCPARGATAAHRPADIGAVMDGDVPGGGQPGPGPGDAPAEATVLRMLLGARLRRLREAAGVRRQRGAAGPGV
jgi:hypothetical protein